VRTRRTHGGGLGSYSNPGLKAIGPNPRVRQIAFHERPDTFAREGELLHVLRTARTERFVPGELRPTVAAAHSERVRGVEGRLIAAASPDVLGILGPLFAPVNPVDAQSTGFTAATYGLGAMGAIGGIPVYVTAGFGTATKRLMVMSTAAAEVYEDRIGALQVVEPSVLGIQVAYAGYFASLALDPAGIIKVTVT